MKRIYSIDCTRGLVMVLMALDHVRDMMHVHSITGSPTDLATTTPALFFTRWITHLCAPTFVFLAGTSAYLSLKKHNNFLWSRHFLITRGIYLILLEFIVVNFLLFFDLGFHTFIFEVIAAIGFSFIILGLLLKCSLKTIALIGLAIIFCHNLFSLIPFEKNSLLQSILSPLFLLTVYPFPHLVFIVAYAPIPWLGIMLLGFATGKFFELPAEKRNSLFVKTGCSALALFVIIRLINIYGDSTKWSVQKTPGLTFLSFLNVTKYPPSLVFCLIMLGVMFLILAATGKSKKGFTKILSVYGKVPLFYFLLHLFLIHCVMLAVMLLQGFHWTQLDFASGTMGRPQNVESGLQLWAIYLIWAGVVIILYKPCVWYGKYKLTHKYWWLKYL